MLKVLLIISAMGIEQTMEFPDMETCLEVRSSVVAQSENVEALCIPAGAEDLTMKRMDMFFIPSSVVIPFIKLPRNLMPLLLMRLEKRIK